MSVRLATEGGVKSTLICSGSRVVDLLNQVSRTSTRLRSGDIVYSVNIWAGAPYLLTIVELKVVRTTTRQLVAPMFTLRRAPLPAPAPVPAPVPVPVPLCHTCVSVGRQLPGMGFAQPGSEHVKFLRSL